MKKTRDLYAEIVEGFAAISEARDGNLTLRTTRVLIPGSGKTGPQVGESEPANGMLVPPAQRVS